MTDKRMKNLSKRRLIFWDKKQGVLYLPQNLFHFSQVDNKLWLRVFFVKLWDRGRGPRKKKLWCHRFQAIQVSNLWLNRTLLTPPTWQHLKHVTQTHPFDDTLQGSSIMGCPFRYTYLGVFECGCCWRVEKNRIPLYTFQLWALLSNWSTINN